MNPYKATLNSHLKNSTKSPKSWKFYLFVWLVLNQIIWGATFIYLKGKQPAYTSMWALAVNGGKSFTNVTVPGIGQASSSSDSPYVSEISDPRENYKLLAESDEILEAAANQLKIPVNNFAKPKIKILDNSTLMKFEIKGDTPNQSQEKALALNNALQAYLVKLRKQDMIKQDGNLKVALTGDEQKLQLAKQRLYEYDARSSLRSSEQLQAVTANLEALRLQRVEMVAQLKQSRAQVQQMSISVGLSAQDATDALKLQSDQLFQQYLADSSKESAELVTISARYLPSHPLVITKQQEKDAAQAALTQQGRSLLGRSISPATLIQLLNSGGSSGGSERSKQVSELLSSQTQQRGIQAQVQELDLQIAALESRLKVLSQEKLQLDNLERDVKIAEAVYSSNLTKLNLSNPAFSASYPEISIFTPPRLPKEASDLAKKLLLASAAGCSFLLTTGIASIWIRDRKLQQAKQITSETFADSNSNPSSRDTSYSVSPKK